MVLNLNLKISLFVELTWFAVYGTTHNPLQPVFQYPFPDDSGYIDRDRHLLTRVAHPVPMKSKFRGRMRILGA
jgi:hypothetical protein